MKRFISFSCVILASLVTLPAADKEKEPASFPGLEKAMTSEQYEAAGLSKLDATERAKLDEFIKHYVEVSNEKVATTTIDKAIAEKKIYEPEVIQSRIVGPFTGYNGRTVFTLENGQRWAQSQFDSAYYPKMDSPAVTIVKSGFGYRMYIAGASAIRVSKVH